MKRLRSVTGNSSSNLMEGSCGVRVRRGGRGGGGGVHLAGQ
jgi:hypothetical protein